MGKREAPGHCKERRKHGPLRLSLHTNKTYLRWRLISVDDLEESANNGIREDKVHVTDRFCSSNKRILDEVATVPSKRLRNKIAGCECIKL